MSDVVPFNQPQLLNTDTRYRMASRTFNVGIIGYGMSAKVFHIPLITTVPELKLYAIVQRNPKSDDDAEKDHSGIKRYHSTEDMVKDDKVDVVIVTTPPVTHLELAKLALENGKHGMKSPSRAFAALEPNSPSRCRETLYTYARRSN